MNRGGLVHISCLIVVVLLLPACCLLPPTDTPEPDRIATTVAAALTAGGSDLEAPPTPTPVASPATAILPTYTSVPPTATPAPPEIPTLMPLCTVVATALNLRYGPGIVYEPPITALPKGTNLEPLARNPDGQWIWVRVQSTNEQGWISANKKYVSYTFDPNVLPLTEVLPTPTPIPTSTITLTPTPTPTPTPAVGSIKGVVEGRDETFEKSSPIAGAKIEAPLAGLETETDDKGQYIINNVPPGEQFVIVGAPPYLSVIQPVTVRAGQIATADFSLIRALPSLQPCLPSTQGTVEGRVLIEESRPAAEAKVWIWRQPFAEAVTSNDGSYTISNACGWLILAEWGDMRGGVKVKFRPGETITAPDIILAPR